MTKTDSQGEVDFLSLYLYECTVEYGNNLSRPGSIDRRLADQFLDIIEKKIRTGGDRSFGRSPEGQKIAHVELHIMTPDELREVVHEVFLFMKKKPVGGRHSIAADPLGRRQMENEIS